MKSKTFITKAFFVLALCAAFSSNFFSQEAQSEEKIRIQLWAELDAMPELPQAQDTGAPVFDYPIERMKLVAPYIVNGLIYGYHFSYTPSDKARKVAESFEVTPLGDIADIGGKVVYKKPHIKEDALYAWVEYELIEDEVARIKSWQSLDSEKISGRGKGKLSRDFEGIKDAVNDAIKAAVRSHYRLVIKNKPKEIAGDVVIKSDVLFGINEGFYTISLDFFLQNATIDAYE